MKLAVAEALCRTFEGLHRVGTDGLVYPYLCPAGVPTQGYGTVWRPDGRKVTMEDPPITRQMAAVWLVDELRRNYGPATARLCPTLFLEAISTGDWARFGAIVDFAYNLGPGRLQTSTLRKRIEAGDWEGAAEELKKWVRGGGRILPGLVRRREAECKLLGV